jgi:hypothetical protein
MARRGSEAELAASVLEVSEAFVFAEVAVLASAMTLGRVGAEEEFASEPATKGTATADVEGALCGSELGVDVC